MDENQRAIGILLSAAIHNRGVTQKISADWEEVFKIADEHDVLPLLYPTVKNAYQSCNGPSDDLINIWSKISLTTALDQTKHINEVNVVLAAFHKANIPVMILKGLILRNLYPKPELRTMGDADLLIRAEDMPAACRLLADLGYIDEGRDEKHRGYVKEGSHIELHTKLLDNRFSTAVRKWEEGLWDRSVSCKYNDISVFTLSVDDQFLYLCLHTAGHFTKSGFGLRQLCDFVLFVEAYADRINWNVIKIKAKEIGIHKFITQLFIICGVLFNARIPEIYADNEVETRYIDLFIEDIFYGGLFGQKTDRIVSGILFNKLGNKNNLPGKFKRWVYLLFPPYRAIKQKYTYIDKYPVLTPVAWIHRLFFNVFINRFTVKKSDCFNIINSDSIWNKRFELIHWLDLSKNL